MIDSAAKGAFDISLPHIEGKRVLFLVGKGNNGSDALEMARLSLNIAKSVLVYTLLATSRLRRAISRASLPLFPFPTKNKTFFPLI